jgi:hypothetical protein
VPFVYAGRGHTKFAMNFLVMRGIIVVFACFLVFVSSVCPIFAGDVTVVDVILAIGDTARWLLYLKTNISVRFRRLQCSVCC